MVVSQNKFEFDYTMIKRLLPSHSMAESSPIVPEWAQVPMMLCDIGVTRSTSAQVPSSGMGDDLGLDEINSNISRSRCILLIFFGMVSGKDPQIESQGTAPMDVASSPSDLKLPMIPNENVGKRLDNDTCSHFEF